MKELKYTQSLPTGEFSPVMGESRQIVRQTESSVMKWGVGNKLTVIAQVWVTQVCLSLMLAGPEMGEDTHRTQGPRFTNIPYLTKL